MESYVDVDVDVDRSKTTHHIWPMQKAHVWLLLVEYHSLLHTSIWCLIRLRTFSNCFTTYININILISSWILFLLLKDFCIKQQIIWHRNYEWNIRNAFVLRLSKHTSRQLGFLANKREQVSAYQNENIYC